MKLSVFGEKFARKSGIVSLMDDLGEALTLNPDMISMGGGNPARIPALEGVYQRHLQALTADPEKTHALLGKYQPPQGDPGLLKQLAAALAAEYGWPLSERNVAVSNGGQSAFYVLANLLGGRHADGSLRQIQFPLTPEYLGYSDAGQEENFFTAARPNIEILEPHLFKYRVDFSGLSLSDKTAALCVSRPTNPTGNVLTDDEIQTLDAMAREKDIPFIIDGAYGTPFPNIIFSEASPHWNENTILLLSLSKLGMPGLRSGFIVASEELIEAYSNANTVLNLACGNLGPMLCKELLKDREIFRLGRELIMPYYRDRAFQALDWCMEELGDLPYYIHKPEGAFFLWLWFKDLPISSQALYERLKAKGLLVIPGHDSFPGLAGDWQHTRECIRLSYAQDSEKVRAGIRLLGRELAAIYG